VLVHPRGVAFTLHVVPPVAQSRQAIPPEPHWLSRKPSWQTPLPSQQPSGQLEGEHTGGAGAHAPAAQTSPIDEQLLHVFPLTPHAVAELPATQVPVESQHPAQVPGPHGCATHAPLSHEAPVVEQFWQAAPPVPHAVL
jgi:hypothetical protein